MRGGVGISEWHRWHLEIPACRWQKHFHMTGKLRSNPAADACSGLAAGSPGENRDSRKGKWKEFKTGLVLKDWVEFWIPCPCKTETHNSAGGRASHRLIDCPIFGVRWFAKPNTKHLSDRYWRMPFWSRAGHCANASFNLTCTIVWTIHHPAVNMFVRNLERICGILCPEHEKSASSGM